MIEKHTIKQNFLLPVVIGTVLLACSSQPKQMPAGVSNDAKWAGGADGGVWISCQDTNTSNEFLCSIFGENGSLWKQHTFRLTESSDKPDRTTATDLRNTGYAWYDGQQIKLIDGKKLELTGAYER